ncbi:zinc ribbon domain-containing protein [Halobium palmae]|uniref:Zinc ribbon domain-containing protein n=1 Tax=Halobium palmae TaxID=1776492 RepID=A0ABD5S2R4_9EURY
MSDTGRRAFVAAMIGAFGAVFGVAGLGHLFLRRWKRAVAWFVLSLGATAVLLSTVFTEAQLRNLQFMLDVQQWPQTVLIPLFVLLSLSIFDAYLTGRRATAEAAVDACPYCGQPIDAELDFCHWCTRRFDRAQ